MPGENEEQDMLFLDASHDKRRASLIKIKLDCITVLMIRSLLK